MYREPHHNIQTSNTIRRTLHPVYPHDSNEYAWTFEERPRSRYNFTGYRSTSVRLQRYIDGDKFGTKVARTAARQTKWILADRN